jgi:hypothetical protein
LKSAQTHGKLYEFIKWAVEATDTHTVEIQNSTCCMIVGTIILIGGDRLYERSPGAWQMFEVLPTLFWGLLYFTSGLTHLVFLRLNMQTYRKYVLLLKAALWIFLGTALAVGVGWAVPAVYIYYVFAAVAFRGYLKIEVEVLQT